MVSFVSNSIDHPPLDRSLTLAYMNMRMSGKRNCLFYSPSSFVLLLALTRILSPLVVAAEDERKMYIVYMGSRLPSNLSPTLFYDKMMKEVLGSQYSKNRSEYLVHTYQRSFYGCVARLTDAEALSVQGIQGVVSVFPNEELKLHTTRSWDFMGFPINVPRSPVERDVIVGVIDTGIWPENPSFNDTGLGPVPSKWKGICQNSSNFSCNRKIIGARFYRADGQIPANEGPSPRDFDGHGTHTASTVAGALVPNASLFGLASGIARGGVPSARIAAYKVCWSDTGKCASADILAAFDDAIADGVDVISMSIGGAPKQYFTDAIAIGAFHAMQRGVLASLSAGNNGSSRGTVGNVAPWLMSVAASTTDRKFFTNVELGNGQVIQGKLSLNPFDPHGKKFPMIYGGDAPNSSFPTGAGVCSSLNRTLVKGKIVMCELGNRFTATGETLKAGAAGIVMRFFGGDNFDGISAAYPLPATVVGLNDGDAILSYLRNLSGKPVGSILKSGTVNDTLAPFVAFFSSRGPNIITPGVLKPDLSAPGVNILAAFSPKGEVSPVSGDTRSVLYHIISGTSMACPHASAAAAYVKSYHSDWSPAAIRSALMTTAFPMNSTTTTQAELAYGAGHINPTRAVDPGLVYDVGEADYVSFLCGQGFTISQIRSISSDVRTTCPKDVSHFAGDLNYPSISVATNSSTFNQIFRRRVKNVANSTSVYRVKVTAPRGLSVVVKPDTLRFTQLGQELSFTVQVIGGLSSSVEVASASIEWFDDVHKVRSPIVAFQS